MWQSIPRTGSLLLRASRPHSIQRFPRCLLSSLHASLPKRPAVSRCLLSPPSMPRSLRPAFPPLPPLLPPCLSPCVQRFPRCLLSPPSMPRSLRPAVSRCLLSPPSASPPAVPPPSLHASLPASSVSPAASSLLPPCCSPCVQRFTRCPSLPPTPCHHH